MKVLLEKGLLRCCRQRYIQKVQEGYRGVFWLVDGSISVAGSSDHFQAACRQSQAFRDYSRGLCINHCQMINHPHVDKISAVLNDHQMPFSLTVSSAHKNPRQVLDLIDQYNESLEPVVCITVAGRSNALSGVVASSLKWPVIAYHPFKDYSDYLTDLVPLCKCQARFRS